MHTPSIELHHLRTFIALAEERHLRRAAARLRLSPPTLRTHIRRLEATLGARLCERGPRGTQARLTFAGEVFLHEARDLLRHLQEILDIMQEARRPQWASGQ
ncbi:MAG: LysR family transcriptional regulator [Kiritimatiellaeota bacterium]|nr:LysR family transcriptional regulator [Kiritimatiellota bacterium]